MIILYCIIIISNILESIVFIINTINKCKPRRGQGCFEDQFITVSTVDMSTDLIKSVDTSTDFLVFLCALAARCLAMVGPVVSPSLRVLLVQVPQSWRLLVKKRWS